MKDDKNKPTDEKDLNPFSDEAWIGCPHCEKGIDICAPIARARRDVGEFVLSLIMNGVRAEDLAAPLEFLNDECMSLELAVRRSVLPLAHLNVYELSRPSGEEESTEEEKADSSNNKASRKETEAQGVSVPCR